MRRKTFHRTKTLRWAFIGECIRVYSHASDTHGYSLMRINMKLKSICRIILERRLGELNFRIVCRHTCDNPWCVNPSHVIPGTRFDNAHDCISRGRNAFGCKNGNSKLSDSDVRLIHRLSSDGFSQVRIANKFGIHQSTVCLILQRRSWKHITKLRDLEAA